ncbi:MAG: DNA-binding domain-containing protein [Myxococcota bacterium]|nr:DNA-binding domain-containing protein [Myxococcota bacterium]
MLRLFLLASMPVAAEAPPGLSELQAQFSEAMRTPLRILDAAGGYAVQTGAYPPALTGRITPDRGQPGAARLSSYNQQYWFRLLTVMQEEYPLLRHLLGVTDFNAMVIDYLTAHPSTSPRLRHLSDRLVGFLEGSQVWGDPQRVQCARLEHAYIQAFDAAHRPPMAMTAAALTAPLTVQPHLSLVVEDWDLVDWRAQVRRDADDAIAVTLSARTAWWAIWRGAEGTIATRLGRHQHALLCRLAAGEPLGAACAGLAETLDAEGQALVVENIQAWFAQWASAGWFC